MTITIVTGDLLDSKAQTLVNTVNCVGVMGKGIALDFKNRFPAMFEDYARRCERGEVRLGRPYLFRGLLPPWILNFPTKDHWRSVASLDAIVEGLEYLQSHHREWGIKSLAVPPLGCGNGQLEWRVVGPTLYRHLSRLEIEVELYAPHGTPHVELTPDYLAGDQVPKPEFIRPAWIALVEVLKRIVEQPYHWPVGRTRFQKMAYVATAAGLPTGFEFKRGSYGPYSPDVKSAEARLINNGLIQEDRVGRMLRLRPGPTVEDGFRAYADDLAQWDELIDKVADLFMRVDTDEAEIVATVLYVANERSSGADCTPTERDLVDAVMDWKLRRRPPLDEQTVASTVRNLAMLNWLDVTPSPDLVPDDDILAIA